MTRYELIAVAGVFAGSIGACSPSPTPLTINTPAADDAAVPSQAVADGAAAASVEPARTAPNSPPAAAARATAPEQTADADRVSLGGVSIAVPAALAKHVAATEIAATASGPDMAPARVRFVLEGYPLVRPDAEAALEVFRGPIDPNTPPTLMSTFREMHHMLALQEASPSHISTMPRPNERQLFASRKTFIGLGVGTGTAVQFVGMFGNTPRPVNNAELMYVVQGLMTAQGSWVSFKAPVTVDDPGIAADATIADPAAFTANFASYMKSTTTLLNALPSSAFTPNLDQLEAVVKSVVVDWAAPTAHEIATYQAAPPFQPTITP